jgi:CDP-diacylglycerol--serine O-phosphatidyltransferase
MLGFFNYTVIATYLSAALAVAGLWLAFEGMPTAAVFCLLFCGLIDMFDGKIARTHKTRSPEAKRYGIQIDSLADFQAFGTLPAVIGFSLWGGSPVYALLAALYVLAALIRLAYFNVTEEVRQDQTAGERTCYTGLPVTTASYTFPLIWCVSLPAVNYFSYIFAALMLLEGALFVSKFKIRKPHGKSFALLCGVGILIFAMLIISTIAGTTI